MSVSVEFGDERDGQPVVQIATNQGWTDIKTWADALDNDDYPELLYFIDQGESTNLSAMIDEIGVALEDHQPVDPTVAKTLQGLQATLAAHKDEPYVLLTDGFHSGYEG